jgi:hypothetical protein
VRETGVLPLRNRVMRYFMLPLGDYGVLGCPPQLAETNCHSPHHARLLLGCCQSCGRQTFAKKRCHHCCGVIFFSPLVVWRRCSGMAVCSWLPKIPYMRLLFLLRNMLCIYFNSKHKFICINRVSCYNPVNRLLHQNNKGSLLLLVYIPEI